MQNIAKNCFLFAPEFWSRVLLVLFCTKNVEKEYFDYTVPKHWVKYTTKVGVSSGCVKRIE